MSERKTSEIKLRVTPSFKAAVQLAAEQAGETMSVYIESASQDRMNVRLGVVTVARTGEPLKVISTTDVVPFGYKRCTDCSSLLPPGTSHAGTCRMQFSASLSPNIAQNPVPAKDADGSCTKNCHPWEWCECKQLRRD